MQRDLLTGIALRDVGIQSVYSHNSAWVDRARAAAKSIAFERGSVCIDEVLEAEPRPPETHPNATGSIFRENCWVKIGYRPSSIPSAHARVVGIYKLKDNP